MLDNLVSAVFSLCLNMKQGKNLSNDIRKLVVKKHQEGLGYRKISKELNIPVPTIGAIVRKWKSCDSTLDLQRSGRPKKISERTTKWMARKVQQNPFITRKELQEDLEKAGTSVSKDTISRGLHSKGLHSRSPRKTPLLKKTHVKARLKFVENYKDKSPVFWEKVLWSDETKIELFGRNTSTHVWRKTGEDHKPINTIPTVKFGGGSIMVWGCFASNGVGEIEVIEGRMDGSKYREILERNVKKSASALGLGADFYFQQDNDPKHTAKMTKKWFDDNNINLLSWPSMSPDLNPIENLWKILKLKVHRRNPQNLNELKVICKEEWVKITPECCNKHVSSYGKRLEAVKQNNGYGTKY